MRNLTPATEAALDAAFTLADFLNREVSQTEMIAAFLRALADHRPQQRTLDGPQDFWDPDGRTRRELRNIAAELIA